MLDTFTAITTSITAVLSVWIAYKSHRTTINQKKSEEEELSIKLMELFKSKISTYSIFLLLLSEENLSTNNSTKIFDFIENNNIEKIINNHIKLTEEFKTEKVEQLKLKDTEILSKSISESHLLLVQIELLKRAIANNEKEEIQILNDKIPKTTKKILNDL